MSHELQILLHVYVKNEFMIYLKLLENNLLKKQMTFIKSSICVLVSKFHNFQVYV